MGIMAAVALLAVPFRNKEARITAAGVIAGEGMIRLTEDAAGEEKKNAAGDAEKNAVKGVKKNAAEHPKVALTFDDGPSRKYTPMLLDGLKERGVKATFFIMGKNIEGNEELIQRMQKEGHLIGNHTYNHVQLNKVPRSLACEEIQMTNNQIYEVIGVYPSYIRPPFGAWQENLELCVTMLPVFWDIDTLDWKSRNVDSIVGIVEKEVKDGAIILMHDEYQTSVDAALKVVDLLMGEGYEFVTVDEMIVM